MTSTCERANRRLATALAMAAVAIAATATTMPAAHTAHAGASAALTLVSQTVEVPSGGPLDITVAVPFDLDPALADATDVVVTSYQRVERRAAVQNAIAGDLGKVVDSIDLPIASVAQPVPGQLQLSIPTEITLRKPELLQLPKPGLYPVVVDVRIGGDVVAELTTFFERLASDPTGQPAPLAVSVVMSTSRPTTIDDDADVTVTPEARAELAALAASIGASSIPVSVSLQPGTLAALAEADAQSVAPLLTALAGDELLARPRIGFDPSSAAAAGQQELYTQWLRDGEDALRQAAPGVRSTRAATFAPGPISAAGASLVRDLGARVLILTPDDLDRLGATVPAPTQLVPIALHDGGELDAAVVDRRLSRWLTAPGDDVRLAAVQMVAELLAIRAEIAGRGDALDRHAIVLGTHDGGAIQPELLAALSLTISAVPQLAAKPISDVAGSASVTTGSIRLPDAAGPDIGARGPALAQLRLMSTATGSMLATDDPRTLGWQHVLDALPSTDVDQAQFDSMRERLERELAAIRADVVPPAPFRFTLAGHSSEIRLNVRNDGSAKLHVRLRLTSLKLGFPEGSEIDRELLPGDNLVTIPVQTRTKGRFPVQLDIVTPDGGVALGDSVALTANVNALTGLGPLVTGGALLILVSWWAHHVRGTRRRRLASGAAARHPVAAGGPGDD